VVLESRSVVPLAHAYADDVQNPELPGGKKYPGLEHTEQEVDESPSLSDVPKGQMYWLELQEPKVPGGIK
jgi:hypothetical protein